jgi:hypothetical protein
MKGKCKKELSDNFDIFSKEKRVVFYFENKIAFLEKIQKKTKIFFLRGKK